MIAAFFVVAAGWPDLRMVPSFQAPAPADAAMIVAVEAYANAPAIAGAFDNAAAWYTFFAKTMQLPPAKIALLRNNEATLEKMRKFAQQTAQSAGVGGTLWFVFIGHGAPARDGKDGLLLGYDAQQDIDSIEARSLRQHELLSLLGSGKQARTVALIDACFSGKGLTKGLQPLVAVSRAATDKALVFTAAKGDQFAGSLPGLEKPAFSYLTLGGLRGWADANSDGQVTAEELVVYTNDSLRALLKDRTQTAELLGASKEPLMRGAREKGPDVASFVLKSEVAFAPTPATPDIKIDAPTGGMKKINMAVEQALDDALSAQESKTASPATKAAAWCKLASVGGDNPHQEKAKEGCWAWTQFGEKQAAIQAALDDDYKTVAAYLRLRHKSTDQKLAVLDGFVSTYARTGGVKVDSVRQMRPAVAAGRMSDLPTETKLHVTLINDLDDPSGLRSVYVQVDTNLVGTLQAPDAGRAQHVFDGVVQPGDHPFRVDMAITMFSTLGMRVYCADTLSLGELVDAHAALRVRNLDGDGIPHVYLRLGHSERQVQCRTETSGKSKRR